MKRLIAQEWIAILLVLVLLEQATASFDSIGPNGINSIDLELTGDGISIGQVEAERPGLPGFDDASNSNSFVIPAAVFIENGVIAPTADSMVEIYFTDPPDPPDAHATHVAGVMIGKRLLVPGVAKDASLYSSLATDNPIAPGNPNWDTSEKLAMAAQHVATRDEGDVWAINMSFLISDLNNGSLLTQFVDWSAAEHETLYVAAWRELQDPPLTLDVVVPGDNFNGMTVAASEKVDGVYRRVAAFNIYDSEVPGGRKFVDIIAPGRDVEVPDVGDPAIPELRSGTSLAAPHVTGTVALLQE